jgi:V/A-type H+-transporting ATPase subunit B
MYSDLATLFERAGVLRNGKGSLTQIPILSMPDDDITHPIPDLTGYITEGQIVLSRELDRAGVFPPVDVLPSLSRVMNVGIGEGQTTPHHRAWSDQLYAVYARGREARLSAGIVGEAGLSEADRRALAFADRFEQELIHQGDRRRSISETVEIGWRLLESQRREDLSRLDEAAWSWRQAQRDETA